MTDLNLPALRERLETEAAKFDGWDGDPERAALLRQASAALLSSAEAREEAERRAAALQLQAQSWGQEARTQKSTVHEAYQAATGATGEPGDWHGAEPIRAALQAAETRAQQFEAVANAARDLIVEGLRLTPDGLIVREKPDRSDPHYRLCTALEAAGLIPSRARQAIQQGEER